MPIPKDILEVERPKNTRVKLNGNRYDVVKRTCVYKNGKNIPKELGKIGEIIDHKYVPIAKLKLNSNFDIKDFGKIELARSVSLDLLNDLYKFYSIDEATTIYVIALLRTVYGNVTDRDLKFRYETSFISEDYPNVKISEKIVCRFLDVLGRHINICNNFMKDRISKIDNNSIAIVDGMLKDCTCKTSEFTNWSRKSRLKGSEEISLLYAFDSLKGEPLAHKIYPGNMLDSSSFSDFVKTFKLKECLIMGDEGFTSKDNITLIDEYKNNYIFPLKRNDSRIDKNNLYDYQGSFKDENDIIEYCKKEVDGIIFYSYRSYTDATNEKKGFLNNAIRQEKYDNSKLKEKEKRFGTIIFISSKDIDAQQMYFLYEKRWEIETYFSFYKNIVHLNNVRVQYDTSIIGSEFINFLSSIIGLRIKHKFIDKKLNEKYSYNQLMVYLSQIKKYYDEGTKKWYFTKTLKYIEEIANGLGITSI